MQKSAQLFWEQLPAKINDIEQLLSRLETADGAVSKKTIQRRLERLLWVAEEEALGHGSQLIQAAIEVVKSETADWQSQLIEQLEVLASAHPTPNHASSAKTRLPVTLVAPYAEQLEELYQQFEFFGETVRWFTSPDAFQAAHSDASMAFILDVSLTETHSDWIQTLHDSHTPLVFLSKEDTLAARLQAVRGGGKAFFSFPFDWSECIEVTQELVTPENTSEPYRILVMEDSKTQAIYIEKTLKKGGMTPCVIHEPTEILDAIADFRPDVILMDLYMPEVNGSELASVIRQQASFVSIPIVFLSAESDIKKQLSVMSLGGDDFLTKPIEPNHLISSMKTRSKRGRALKAAMIQDALTGLLNHTHLLERLEIELRRAERNQSQLTFVMVDIDHFKSVNDQHGHPVGDKVIKALAKLLKQNLRSGDFIGRYGGEEFAIILPDTPQDSIIQHLNDIRCAFEKLHFTNATGDLQFHCTFSAGIACWPHPDVSMEAVVNAADTALYEAKRQGRNQCVRFQSK